MKIFFNLRNVVAIAICLAAGSIFLFTTCNKEEDLDKGFGWIKYNGETYYLREDPRFGGGIKECDEYFINEQNPFGGWKVHQWWFQSYGVYSAKNKKGVYCSIYYGIYNSEFSAPMGTFFNVKYVESGCSGGCPNDIEKGVICSVCFYNHAGYGEPYINIDDGSGSDYHQDYIVSGSVEIKPKGENECEVKGTFNTKSGKTAELSYRGTLRKW